MNVRTNWKLYTSNEEAWNDMLADCAAATESISLEQFIFVDDDYGRKLIDTCAERAAAGVKVRFIWDAAGSFSFFGSDIAARLHERGIELVFWKTLLPPYFKIPNFRSWYLRNHRRTLAIDDKIAYTGSICVADSMKNWRDTNVRITGSVVQEMTNAFERMWQRAQGSKKLPSRVRPIDPYFQYMTNQPRPGRRHLYVSILEAIRGAEKSISITTPYFVPTHRLFRAIRLAAHRGVDVRIILPERTDHYPTLDIAARSYFLPLLESGARIYLYRGNIIHSKTIIIDEQWSTVGSLNMDNASLLYNFEANIVSRDPLFAAELASHFEKDLRESRPVSLAEWQNRFFLERIPEALIRLVRKFL